MLLDFEKLPPRDAYGWMISAITPRPIAWVTTLSADGRTNLAPYSFFQGVCSNPPTLLFVPTNTRDGGKKDTLANCKPVGEGGTGQFAVCVATEAIIRPVAVAAEPLPHGESEIDHVGLATVPATRVRPPRLAEAPVAFECALDRIVRVGEGVGAGNVVLGRILVAHVSESVLGPAGAIDPRKLDTIGRMGGDFYTRTTELFTLDRPTGGSSNRS